jgi:hypothetical protein
LSKINQAGTLRRLTASLNITARNLDWNGALVHCVHADRIQRLLDVGRLRTGGVHAQRRGLHGFMIDN